jgi:hypothetical protein
MVWKSLPNYEGGNNLVHTKYPIGSSSTMTSNQLYRSKESRNYTSTGVAKACYTFPVQ